MTFRAMICLIAYGQSLVTRTSYKGPNPVTIIPQKWRPDTVISLVLPQNHTSDESDDDVYIFKEECITDRSTYRDWMQSCHLSKTDPIVLLTCLIETVLLIPFTLENKLLADMSVHLIDFDLLDAIGLKRVLDRQCQLGAGIHTSHLEYIPYVFVALVVWLFIQNVLANRIWYSYNVQVRKAFPRLLGALVFFLFLTRIDVYMLEEKQLDFKGVLPFNFLGISEKRLIHLDVEPKLMTLSEAMENRATGKPTGYAHKVDIPITIQNKKNIIIIIGESGRYDEFSHMKTPKMMSFAEDPNNNCIHPNLHMPNAHVTEMSMFSIFYGLNPWHLLPFGYNYVDNFVFQILHQNGYHIADFASSTMWLYPNAHTTEQLDEYAKYDFNEDLDTKLEQFLQTRDNKTEPFFLLLFLDRVAQQYQEILTKENLKNGTVDIAFDISRERILKRLADHDQLTDKSMIIFSSDHGDMQGEHGEEGHGQREGSWWSEKTKLHTWICIPSTEPMNIYNLAPAFGSHQDFVPTMFDFLNLEPKVPRELYTTGRSLLQPPNEDWTSTRFIFASARYFPYKNKILMVADKNNKFWFRVNGMAPDGTM
eukprot:Ihof_evm2s821 gene=Ihof_evmTU2s821